MPDLAKDQLAIEDVLSSIRRLVAEDQNAMKSTETGSRNGYRASGRGTGPSAPKLVLTDEQRVAETRALEQGAQGRTAQEGDQAIEDPDAPTLGLEAAPRTANRAAMWSPDDRLMDFDTGNTPGARQTPHPEADGDATSSHGAKSDAETFPSDPEAPTRVSARPSQSSQNPEPLETEVFPASRSGEASDESVPSQDLDTSSRDAAFLDDASEFELAGFGDAGISHDENDGVIFDTAEDFEAEIGDTDWPDPAADQAVRVLAGTRAQLGDDSLAKEAFEGGETGQTEADADAFWATAAALSKPMSTDADDHPGAISRPIWGAALEGAGLSVMAAARPNGAGPDAESPAAPAGPPKFSRRRQALEALAEQHVERDTEREAATSESEIGSDAQEEVAPDPSIGPENARVKKVFSPFPDAPETPEADAKPETDVEDLGDRSDAFQFPDLEGLSLDEDTLRDLIAEVVREELRGVLGQRITRNVRKMVRREIRIALAAEDFD